MSLKEFKQHSTSKKYKKTITVDEFIDNALDLELTYKECSECETFNKNWACPSFDFDLMDFWNKYETLDVYVVKSDFDKDLANKHVDGRLIQKFFTSNVTKLKNELFRKVENDPDSILLSGGQCHLCKECARIIDEPCRHPDKMTNSIESYGGDVGKLISYCFDFPLQWPKNNYLPEYLCACSVIVK